MNTDEQAHKTEITREWGKKLFYGRESSKEEKQEGLNLIIDASRNGDAESNYILGKLLLEGRLSCRDGKSEEEGLKRLYYIANRGYIGARVELNRYCMQRYNLAFEGKYPKPQRSDKLIGFDGKPIRIKRRGKLTPVDAVLEYRNGEHVLSLSANASFLLGEEVADPAAFRRAVIQGIRDWEGEFEVFGSQKVRVEITITQNKQMLDNVIIVALGKELSEMTEQIVGKLGTGKKQKRFAGFLASKRSFSTLGINWSVHSPKLIYVLSERESFDDYDEIRDIARHEFGHILGLGDIYASPTDGLEGVDKGEYAELDSFLIHDKTYNLVMCNNYGNVSNNDIEMVILAFCKNKMQLYQKQLKRGKISDALGRGN